MCNFVIYTLPTTNCTSKRFFSFEYMIMKKVLYLLILLLGFLCNGYTQCIEFATPYQNLSAIGFGASLCGDNCRDTMILANGVWPNEAYIVDDLAPGAQYKFNYCEGYSTDVWNGMITAVQYTPGTLNEVELLEENILQVEEGCEMLLTIPTDFKQAVHVAFVVTKVDSCGTGLRPFEDNGVPYFGCGPDGGQPQCPKLEISCLDMYAGTLATLDSICVGDVMGINVRDIKIPTKDNSGFVLVVSTEDLEGNTKPNDAPSFVTILDTIIPTLPPNGTVQNSFIHDESILEAGTYFLTPVSFGNAVIRDPKDPFQNFRLDESCTSIGSSIPFTLLPVEASICIQSCKKINDGSFETGKPNNVWEEYSLNFDSPLCDSTCAQGVNFAFNGNWWAWFGGFDNGEEEGVLAQDFNLHDATNAVLSFRVAIILEPEDNVRGDDEFAVRIDNETIFSITDRDHTDYELYELIELDLSEYADGCPHNLQLYGKTKGGEEEFTNFFVDDIQLNACSTVSCSAEAGVLAVPDKDTYYDGGEVVQVGLKEGSRGDCMTYAYVLTTGAPNYEIFTINETGAFLLDALDASLYNVHGFAYDGTMEELMSHNFTNALDIQAAIESNVICGDIMMEEEEIYDFVYAIVGIEEGMTANPFAIQGVTTPANDHLAITFSYPNAGEKLQVGIYDLYGKLLHQEVVLSTTGVQQLDMSLATLNLLQGMYLITLSDKETQVSFKWLMPY